MVAQAEHSDLLTRDQVASEDTWDLTTLYASEDAWNADVARIPDELAAAVAHRGHLGDSAARLAQALDDIMRLRLTLEWLSVYAMLRRDEDTSNVTSLARFERAVALGIEAGQALAFFEPELLGLPPARLAALVDDPALQPYRHLLDNLQRERSHVRSTEVEEVLAQNADVARAAGDAFTALDNADLTYGRVHDDSGAEVTLTKARYQLLLHSKQREVRREASETFNAAYLAHKYTLAALHAASVRKDIFSARVRHYSSAREAALFADNIPVSVFDNLIAAVRAAHPLLARWLGLRRRILGLDQLAMYDLYVPLSPEPERFYDYREAVALVLSGIAPLGDRYVNELREGLAHRWVDVHETKGKRSGAYSWGAYGAPPVMLMNWNRTLSDVFTLAHEAGHAMHSLLADAVQPFHDAAYPIFLAEIASTVNETLLTWHLLDQLPATDRLGRFDLLNRFADTFFATVVRQTMFAEFEQRTHAHVESGQPLTLDTLTALYDKLYAVYHPGILIDDGVRIQWGRIPHFYRAFYVYQYATGLCTAISLARAIWDEGEPARERYLGLLAAGGADYPLPILQRAGVDLTSPRPIEIGLAEFARVVTEMEHLVDEGTLSQSGASG